MINPLNHYRTSLLAGCFCVGILFFCLYQEWIIVQISFGTKPPLTNATGTVEKKNVRFYFWKQNKWNFEDIEIIWSENVITTLEYLVKRWLALADEEGVLHKKVMLQTASLSESGNNAYLSFDRYPFNQEGSTFEKLSIIEGLLKTLKESGINILHIHFLVHHAPIQDYHLDFSHPWPLYGFLS